MNRVVRWDGAAVWHHLRSLYPIPVGPGVDELEVLARLNATSSSEISGRGQVLRSKGLKVRRARVVLQRKWSQETGTLSDVGRS